MEIWIDVNLEDIQHVCALVCANVAWLGLLPQWDESVILQHPYHGLRLRTRCGASHQVVKKICQYQYW